MKKFLCGMLMAVLLAGCGRSSDSITLHVAAAASLESSLDELIDAYEKEHPNIHVEATYDASGKLQAQIEQGADVDIFFSAAIANMDVLVDEELIDEESVIPVLENELVWIRSKDGKVDDIEKASTIAIGDPASVPAGAYAKEALEDLGLYDDLVSKMSFGSNVSEVLRWTEAQSADVGIVYGSDCVTSDKVKIIGTLDCKTPIIYPIGQLMASQYPDQASELIKYLTSDTSLKVYESYGFKGA